MPSTLACASRRVVDAGGDERGESRAPPVGQTGLGVGFVHDEWQFRAAGGKVGRQCDVATESDDDVGADRGEDRRRLMHRRAHARRHGQQ